MQKLLCLVFLGFSGTIYSDSYQDLRERKKLVAYTNQKVLIKDKKKYYAFIEQYLQKAETALLIPRYFRNNFDVVLCEEYFTALFAYIAADFYKYLDKKNSGLDQARQDLLSVMSRIQQQCIGTLNINWELNETVKLCRQATIAYYKRLNLGAKMLVGMMA